MWSVLLELDGRLTQRCIEALPDWSIETLAQVYTVYGTRYAVHGTGGEWNVPAGIHVDSAHSGDETENFASISLSLVVCIYHLLSLSYPMPYKIKYMN